MPEPSQRARRAARPGPPAAVVLAALHFAGPVAAQPGVRGPTAPDTGGAPVTRMVDVGEYRLRVRTAGTASADVPTVVFENGLGAPLDSWDAVQRAIARETATFAYDRVGLGGSDGPRPGAAPPTIERTVETLHALLARAGARPPYVLVGHSLGGPLVRLFAARYPAEVAGLVYVDPSPFATSRAAHDSVWRAVGVPDGRRRLERLMFAPPAPPALRGELAMARTEFVTSFARVRRLAPTGDVPTIAVLAGRYEPPLFDGPFPGGPAREAAFFAASVRQRVAHFTREVRAGDPRAEGTIVVTPNSGHQVHTAEPDLVVWAIRRALHPDPGRRLARAAARGGADSALALYTALRARYPATAFTERTLNAVGYALLGRGALADAVRVFERNVAEYPQAANPYDSLGEAYMAQGDRARAIRSYERSLELDPLNTNAVERLRTLRGP